MLQPRSAHGAGLLTNGVVLVTGGVSGGPPPTYSAEAELYTPSAGTWRQIAPMTQARSGHSQTALANGMVLVAGGINSSSGFLFTSEIYNPATETWRLTTGAMLSARLSHKATVLLDGRVLLTGGQYSGIYPPFATTASAETYSPATDTWTWTGAMSTPRYLHTATRLANGKVLVAGGYDGTTTYASAELYDPISGMWAPAGSMSYPRRAHTATLLPNGKVLVAGGYSGNGIYPSAAELYEPTNGLWTATGSLGQARADHTATMLANGEVLVAGGDSINYSYLNSAELYRPSAGTWASTASLSTPRYAHKAVDLPNGAVLVMGGLNGTYMASAEFFSFSLRTPITLTSPVRFPSGAFQFGFTNTPGATFSALATTNPAGLLTNWTRLGPVTEVSPGSFRFADPQATNISWRLYSVTCP